MKEMKKEPKKKNWKRKRRCQSEKKNLKIDDALEYFFGFGF